ncbi:hypothetical protein Psta_1327 [Pirellula staleyi DSM 6068]|uniref:Uncharacterized protein n=1 Tax=Pirellula staleyi (strain ATCC 27377 / DSM 6068 / ICPB 4128) TaxID=530564 RepID=D2QWC9_PIRSD|nr:hypothetical protein [Pirellula staleyi]ADB16004.1 hypothetical protein Psta_1327 [Pirellula staleyi DSM 6068]
MISTQWLTVQPHPKPNQRPAAGLSKVYYLAWRLRPHHAWRSEEFEIRAKAYERYFSLIERGYDAVLEVRSRSAVDQQMSHGDEFYGETT